MIPDTKWAEIIKDFHEKGVPDLITRKIGISIDTPLKRAISLIGPRRAGKTYTMYQLIKELLPKVPIEQTLYVNFEKTDIEGAGAIDLANLMEVFYSIYPENKKEKVWVFLDEVQNVANWEKFVRTTIDNENVRIFLSGSSSKLLSKEIATSMRGRTLSYTILPFSFRDFLCANNLPADTALSSSQKARVVNKLQAYMKSGGYPEVVLDPEEKEKILADILETTIYRDIVERHKIRNTKILKLAIKGLINSCCRDFSVHKFHAFLKSSGLKSSKNTLYSYIDALADVFFIFPVRKFSGSYKEMEQSLQRVYISDNGLLTSNGISDNGRLMENLVLVELKRREENVCYYKTPDGREVDFVVLKNQKPSQLIQVCFSIEDMLTKEREIKGILKASKELKCSNLLIITWSFEGKEKIKGKTIKFLPLWKWLLT